MSHRSSRATRQSLSPRNQRLLAAVTSLRPLKSADLATRAGYNAAELLHGLWALRRRGVARDACLWAPARVGAAVESLTYVTLRAAVPAGMATFEAACQADAAVTSAVALTGGADYALWSYHTDEATAQSWLRELQLRPEIARAERRDVRVVFGHLLSGAPVYRD